ncbi:hypothetical protein HYW94_04015 [Candidatus Uhrbacteria bacterium]|nr:hypothetical protein [Candidatus Uhrbacteria bacterium]
MSALLKRINAIPKSTFTFSDIRKIAEMNDESLRVSMNRLVNSGRVLRIIRGVYAHDLAHIDWEHLAQELYAPSYLSFESVLGRVGILSQKPYALTLATTKRTRTIEAHTMTIRYHHIQPRLYWGYTREHTVFIAEPEKAFLDLAYLSLKGYATYDPSEMDLTVLDSAKILRYLKKFNCVQLSKRITPLF